MTDTSTLASTQTSRPPLYRDATVVKWFSQVLALLLVVGALAFLAVEAGDNLEAKSIATDFDFLNVNPGFNLSEGIDTDPDTGGRALWVGMVNTFRLAIAGLFVATLLGVLIGIARLSSNWMVSKAASAYIETIRNVPVLVQILFYAAVLGGLGRLSPDSSSLGGFLYISSKGIGLPRVFASDGFYQWLVIVLIGVVVGAIVRRRRITQQELTGQITYPNLYFLGVVALFGLVGWFIHPVFGWLGGVFDAVGDGWDAIPWSSCS